MGGSREGAGRRNPSCPGTRTEGGNEERVRFEVHAADLHWMHCSFMTQVLSAVVNKGGVVWRCRVSGGDRNHNGSNTHATIPALLQLYLKVNFLFKIKFCFRIQAVVIFFAERLCLGFLDQAPTVLPREADRLAVGKEELGMLSSVPGNKFSSAPLPQVLYRGRLYP